jgi:hypothetical protein
VQEWLSEVWAWVLQNREWLFSGIGVLFISVLFSVFQFRGQSKGRNEQSVQKRESVNQSSPARDEIPQKDYWAGIAPENSKYASVESISNSIPIGIQSFTFEYSPNGHAREIQLHGARASVHIQFTCQIKNPMKAISLGNDYALNFLCPRFLVIARGVLESGTVSSLRENREEFSSRILDRARSEFETYGIDLLSVTLGDIRKL